MKGGRKGRDEKESERTFLWGGGYKRCEETEKRTVYERCSEMKMEKNKMRKKDKKQREGRKVVENWDCGKESDISKKVDGDSKGKIVVIWKLGERLVCCCKERIIKQVMMFYLCSVKLDVVVVMGAQEDLKLCHARG